MSSAINSCNGATQQLVDRRRSYSLMLLLVQGLRWLCSKDMIKWLW
jgi:hypothetical protein